MKAIPIHVDIVSLEKEIFSGLVQILTAPGVMGTLGVQRGHAALLTTLEPGYIKIVKQDGEKEFFYVSGGMLEVQPNCVTVLADAAEHARDLDEKAALEAKSKAKEILLKQGGELDHYQAQEELAKAVAMLRVIQQIRNVEVK